MGVGVCVYVRGEAREREGGERGGEREGKRGGKRGGGGKKEGGKRGGEKEREGVEYSKDGISEFIICF